MQEAVYFLETDSPVQVRISTCGFGYRLGVSSWCWLRTFELGASFLSVNGGFRAGIVLDAMPCLVGSYDTALEAASRGSTTHLLQAPRDEAPQRDDGLDSRVDKAWNWIQSKAAWLRLC